MKLKENPPGERTCSRWGWVRKDVTRMEEHGRKQRSSSGKTDRGETLLLGDPHKYGNTEPRSGMLGVSCPQLL